MITPGFRAPAVRAGASIAQAFQDLQREEAAWRIPLFPGGDMLQWQTPGGTILTGRTQVSQFDHPWRTFLQGKSAIVLRGTVNAIQPIISAGAGGAGVYLDGSIPGGDPTPNAGHRPVLDLSAAPTADNQSWVGLQVILDPSTGAIRAGDPTAVQIVHVLGLDPNFRDGGSPDQNGLGIEPLAVVIWSADLSRIIRIDQIAERSYHHRYVAATAGQGSRGRHFFWS